MILSKSEIEARISNGLLTSRLRAVEVDIVSACLHLDNQFCQYIEYPTQPIIPPYPLKTDCHTLSATESFPLPPGGKVLACSEEVVTMPLDLMGFIQTKGSIARGFLMAHPCDGQIDPGYKGKITFEIVNLSDVYYSLVPGMAFASLFLHQISSTVQQGYSGRYQDSYAPTSMRK